MKASITINVVLNMRTQRRCADTRALVVQRISCGKGLGESLPHATFAVQAVLVIAGFWEPKALQADIAGRCRHVRFVPALNGKKAQLVRQRPPTVLLPSVRVPSTKQAS
jgi:hypothetical protein